jgi:holo-[acyl-carrier protein] synthase
MILGLGSDIVDIQRIESLLQRFSPRFQERVFTPQEQATAARSPFPAASYAKRFAAKEAFLKAVGTGLDQGVSWQDVEVLNRENGQPYLKLSGSALPLLESLAPKGIPVRIDLTLSDTPTLAHAIVLLSAAPSQYTL